MFQYVTDYEFPMKYCLIDFSNGAILWKITKNSQWQEIGVEGAFEGESSGALVRAIESCTARTEW